MDIITYAKSREYTDETVIGGGAIAGKPCQIESITDIPGGHRITFKWELDDGTVKNQSLDIMDGVKGDTGEKGEKGDKGDAGFDPQVLVKKSTANEYILQIQDVDSDYDTPNLMGSSGGVIGSYDEENENVIIS